MAKSSALTSTNAAACTYQPSLALARRRGRGLVFLGVRGGGVGGGGGGGGGGRPPRAAAPPPQDPRPPPELSPPAPPAMTSPLSPEEIETLARRRASAKLGWYVHAAAFVLVNALL